MRSPRLSIPRTAYTTAGAPTSFLPDTTTAGWSTRPSLGLLDKFFLGASFDIQNFIGKDTPEPNVPGVIAKIKFTDGWESFPISFAVGYDSFYIGEQGKRENDENKLNRMIYGPYFVITKPIYLLDDEQHIHGGMRMPTQPDYVPEDTAYFIGVDIPLGEFFRAEIREPSASIMTSGAPTYGSITWACGIPISTHRVRVRRPVPVGANAPTALSESSTMTSSRICVAAVLAWALLAAPACAAKTRVCVVSIINAEGRTGADQRRARRKRNRKAARPSCTGKCLEKISGMRCSYSTTNSISFLEKIRMSPQHRLYR